MTRMIDRRTFTKMAGVTGAGSVGALSGCLGGEGESMEYQRPIDMESIPPEEGLESNLHVWQWYAEWAEWGIEAFSEEYPDVENLTHDAYASPSEWFTPLEAGEHEIDVVGGNPPWIARAVQNDLLEPIPHELLDGWEDIEEIYRDAMEEHFSAEGGVYAIPHSIVLFPVLVYNTNEFDTPPESFDVLWDEQYEDEIMIFAHRPEAAGQLAALYLGQDPNDPNDFEEIQEVLIDQKPLNLTYGEEHESAMQLYVNEDIVVGTHTDGRIFRAIYDHDAPVDFVIPEEGTMYITNEFAIPVDAPNPRSALTFVDFMTSADETWQRFVESTKYRPPVQDIEAVIEPSDEAPEGLINDLMLEDGLLDELYYSGPLDEDVLERYEEVWTEVQAA